MKQIITYLVVTVLGLLSPSMSSWAQNFSGVFKQITSPEEFTAGYYIITNPDSPEALTSTAGKPSRGVVEILHSSSMISKTEIKDPYSKAVWKVEKNSSGNFTLQNVQSKKYLASKAHNELLESKDAEKSFTFGMHNSLGNTLRAGNLGLLFSHTITPHAFVFSKVKSKALAPTFFKLVEQENIPFTISAAKYATYYGEKAVKLPAGLKAHIGKVDASKHIVQLTAISDVVPAKTAVIITGEAGAYSLTVTTEAGSISAVNDLKGSSTEIPFASFETSKDYYALAQSPENKVCFGLLKTDLPAGKAYFTLPKAAGSAPQFLGEFLVSSVQQVQRNTTEGAIYDLNGKKVTHPVSGNVYVRNGKKFIFLR